MGFLTTIAQSGEYYNTYSLNSDDAAAAGALAIFGAGFMFVAFLFGIGMYVFSSICLMRIFKKAGVPSWIAWVPFYNSWKILEIGGQQGYWAILGIIPFINFVSYVFVLIAQYHIGKKLGKGGEFVAWAVFLPLVWYIWLAFDQSTWNDGASTAPSLHRPTAPTPPAAV